MRRRQNTPANYQITKSTDAKRAFNSVIRKLTRRDYSVLELRKKLKPWYEEAAIDSAIEKALGLKYIKSETELSEIFSRSLHRRHKGIITINNELKKRGLPPVRADHSQELEKCLAQLAKKFSNIEKWTAPLRVKAFRYLTARGFDSETINLAIKKSKI